MAAAVVAARMAAVHSKRLRVAHDQVIMRLRGSKEAAGLIALFDKHFKVVPIAATAFL